MSTSIGQINLDLGVNTSGFKSQLNGITKQTGSWANGMTGIFSKIGTAIGAAFAVKGIVDFSKACISLGSDLAEVQNVVDVTFGSMSSQVNAFSKNAMTQFGLSEKVAKQYMGTFGAMSKAFGYTTEEAYAQAAALTGLAGDVASFYNLTTEEAYTKLKSVFTGETESLKDLGVVMTQTALDEYALQRGLGKTTKDMSEQEKVALRLAFVTDRLSGATGDFQRTSGGWANQTRVLSLQFESLKATIGQGLINALTPVLRVVNSLIAKLQILAEAFKLLTEEIFGDAGSSSINSTADALSGAGESFADNMDSGASSAKAIKKQLAGFDKLNVLGSGSAGADDSGGTGGGTGLSGLGLSSIGDGLLGDTTEQVEKVKNILKTILGYIPAIGAGIAGWKLGAFIADLATAGVKAEGLKQTLALLGKKIGITAGITLAITGIVIETKGIISAIQDELNTTNLVEILAGGGLTVAGVALVGAQFGVAAISAAVAAVVVAIPAYFVGIYDAIKNELNWMNGALIGLSATAAGAGIGAIIGALGGPIGAGVGALVGLIIGLITDFFIWFWQKYDEIKAWFLGLPTWAQVLIGALLAVFAVIGVVGMALPVLIAEIGAAVITIIKEWDAISKFFVDLWNNVKAMWNTIADWFNVNVIQPIIRFLAPVIQAIAEVFGYAVAKYTEIKNGVVTAISVIYNKVREIYLKIVEIFTALAWAFKEYIWNPLVDKVSKFYNDKIKPIVDKIKDAATAIWNAVKTYVIDKITAKIEEIKAKLTWLRDVAVAIFKALGTAIVDNIAGHLKGTINAILFLIEGRINMFIRLLNGAIGIINKIPGVDITKVSEISIPKLATGGYVAANTPQLAIIGDNKREGEIVAPESKIAEAVAHGVAAAMSKMQQIQNAQRSTATPVIIKIGETDFWEGFIDFHNSVVRRTGESPLLV